MHEEFGTFKYVDSNKLLENAFIAKPVFTLRHKHSKHGKVTGYKVRASYPEDKLIPGVHYHPETIAEYVADRDAVRLMLAIAAQMSLRPITLIWSVHSL